MYDSADIIIKELIKCDSLEEMVLFTTRLKQVEHFCYVKSGFLWKQVGVSNDPFNMQKFDNDGVYRDPNLWSTNHKYLWRRGGNYFRKRLNTALLHRFLPSTVVKLTLCEIILLKVIANYCKVSVEDRSIIHTAVAESHEFLHNWYLGYSSCKKQGFMCVSSVLGTENCLSGAFSGVRSFAWDGP